MINTSNDMPQKNKPSPYCEKDEGLFIFNKKIYKLIPAWRSWWG